MADQQASVWLGARRKPVRMIMITSIALLVGLAVWLILGRLFFGTGIGLKQFLSPTETPSVAATIIVGFVALLFTGIYFSDQRGMIELRQTSPMDIISLIISRMSMIAIASLVCVMFYEVISRYLFVSPTLWANELSLWIASFIFLFAGLYAMQQRCHIRIYIIYDMFPGWLQKASDMLSVFLIWTFTFTLVWGGFNEARDKYYRWETFGTAWDPPIPATVKPAILIVISLVSLQALLNLISDWNNPPEHHSPMDEIDEAEVEIIRHNIQD